ncbi:hypothetical protein U1Q18_028276 [Sarracenia purpurea var. burkii]
MKKTWFTAGIFQIAQSSASEPYKTYLSISTPLLSHGVLLSYGLPRSTLEVVKGICSDVVEIVEPAREGYQLTLRLDFAKIPHGKDSVKMITEISTVQAVILSSQLKEMFRNVVSSQDASQGIYRPIKLVYHQREPFFVIKQPTRITAVFPIRFKENTDVIIATAFFQELMDVGSSEAWDKAPHCAWSPIPPPELRGESFEDLSPNGGDDEDEHLQRPMKLKPRTVADRTILSRLSDFSKMGIVSEPDGEEAEQPAPIQKLGFQSLFSLLL